MKKFCLPVMILSLSSAVFFGYKYYSLVNIAPIVQTVDTSKCGPCMAYNNVGVTSSRLDMNLVKTMAYNFQNTTQPSVTRSVWFSLETMKHFIWQIENKTCSCKGNLGVRVYFGKYPSLSNWNVFSSYLSSLTANYHDINTIFMVPTVDVTNGQGGFYHNDFDPADPSGCGLSSYDTKKYGIASKENSFSFTTTLSGNPITALMAQNHGDACPPPTPPATSCPVAGAYFDY